MFQELEKILHHHHHHCYSLFDNMDTDDDDICIEAAMDIESNDQLDDPSPPSSTSYSQGLLAATAAASSPSPPPPPPKFQEERTKLIGDLTQQQLETAKQDWQESEEVEHARQDWSTCDHISYSQLPTDSLMSSSSSSSPSGEMVVVVVEDNKVLDETIVHNAWQATQNWESVKERLLHLATEAAEAACAVFTAVDYKMSQKTIDKEILIASKCVWEETLIQTRAQELYEFYRLKRQRELSMTPWETYLDIAGGSAARMPWFIREAFWNTDFNDRHRMLVILFTILNGVPFEILDRCLYYTLGFDDYRKEGRANNIRARYKYYFNVNRKAEDINPNDEPQKGSDAYRRRALAWSYNMREGRVMTLLNEPCDKKTGVPFDPRRREFDDNRRRRYGENEDEDKDEEEKTLPKK